MGQKKRGSGNRKTEWPDAKDPRERTSTSCVSRSLGCALFFVFVGAPVLVTGCAASGFFSAGNADGAMLMERGAA
jgi:hypothetical protein